MVLTEDDYDGLQRKTLKKKGICSLCAATVPSVASLSS